MTIEERIARRNKIKQLDRPPEAKPKKKTLEERKKDFLDECGIDFIDGFWYYKGEMITELDVQEKIMESFTSDNTIEEVMKLLIRKGRIKNKGQKAGWHNVVVSWTQDELNILKNLESTHCVIPFKAIAENVICKHSERVYVFWGMEGSGKSVFTKLLVSKIGREFCHSFTLDDFQDTHGIAEFFGKKLVFCDDLGDFESAGTGIGKLKTIITGGAISLNPKFRARFTTELRLNMVLNSNPPPNLDNTAQGLTRRLYIYRTKRKLDFNRNLDFHWEWLPLDENNTRLNSYFSRDVLAIQMGRKKLSYNDLPNFEMYQREVLANGRRPFSRDRFLRNIEVAKLPIVEQETRFVNMVIDELK